MKTQYAILGQNNAVLAVVSNLPQHTNNDYVELSEEQANLLESRYSFDPPTVYFYEDGTFVSLEQKKASVRQQQKAKLKPLSVEEWVSLSGFSPLKVVALMDIESKLKAAGKQCAKITAVRQWLDTITASFVLNPAPRNDWPDAPHSFEETIQEAVSVLSETH